MRAFLAWIDSIPIEVVTTTIRYLKGSTSVLNALRHIGRKNLKMGKENKGRKTKYFLVLCACALFGVGVTFAYYSSPTLRANRFVSMLVPFKAWVLVAFTVPPPNPDIEAAKVATIERGLLRYSRFTCDFCSEGFSNTAEALEIPTSVNWRVAHI